MFTQKSAKECTGCCRPASWPTNLYFEQPHTPGLWKHVTCLVWINLCVDNFGMKYIGCEHLQHLYDALRKEKKEIVEDWTGDLYCGIILKWNYGKHHVDHTMPAYVKK
jgi:hypothetical protein